MKRVKIVPYYRVSTQRQGRSGLGLDAQRKAVRLYADLVNGEIMPEFIEIETGKNSNRTELAKAVARARSIRGRLVVATLDRLARKVAFIANLMESKVDFACADSPNATPFELHIRASMAEEEGRKISERTRNALEAAKARGVKLGTARPGHLAKLRSRIESTTGWNTHLAKMRKNASAAIKVKWEQRRRDTFSDYMDSLKERRKSGETYEQLADWLNGTNCATANGRDSGKRFHATTVMRLLQGL